MEENKVPRWELPCRKCGAENWYVKGTQAYCRTCRSNNLKANGVGKKRVEPLPVPIGKSFVGNGEPTSNHESKKTHCANGHEFNEENTLWTKKGKYGHVTARRCRKCNRNYNRIRMGLEPHPEDAAPDRSVRNILLDDTAE